MSEPTEPPCMFATGVAARRRDCICDECFAITREETDRMRERYAEPERKINEAAPELLQRNLLGGKMTIEETETPVGFAVSSDLTEAELVLAYTKHVLNLFGGNKTKAARSLGIDRRSLYRRLGLCLNKEPTDVASDRSGNE